MNAPARFARLLQEAPRGWLVVLLALMVMVSLTEGVGLLLLVPLLGLLGGQGDGGNPLVTHLLATLQAVGMPLSVGGLLVAFLVLIGFRSAVQYARERLAAKLQHQIVDRMRERCFAALLGVEWRWIAAGRKANHANLLLTDVSRVGVGLNFGLSLLVALVTLLAYVFAAFVLSWSMAAVVLISGGLVFGLLSRHRRGALLLGRSLGNANRALHGNVQESLAGIKLAKILGNESRHLASFLKSTGHLREQQLSFVADTSLSRALFQVGGAVLLCAYLYLGLTVWRVPLPELLTLVLLFSRMIPLSMTAHQQYHHWLHAMPALNEIDELLRACRQAAEPEAPVAGVTLPVRESVTLRRVSVRYEGRDQPALKEISVRFPARTTTAIMGPSGAGKSTLADVLMGLLYPDEGELEVDGVPIVGEMRMAWRRSVAYVPQEVFLFHDSIRNNLLWAAPDASEAALHLALQQSAADFVFELPQGLDTQVGDGGVRLSGGECQRIAIARTLLQRPSLLILDEATSSLDMENEARVRQAIENLHGDLTVVIIGHRLPTLEHADLVVVLAQGCIAQQGRWAEMKANSSQKSGQLDHC